LVDVVQAQFSTLSQAILLLRITAAFLHERDILELKTGPNLSAL
jgi:hypothetical protein